MSIWNRRRINIPTFSLVYSWKVKTRKRKKEEIIKRFSSEFRKMVHLVGIQHNKGIIIIIRIRNVRIRTVVIFILENFVSILPCMHNVNKHVQYILFQLYILISMYVSPYIYIRKIKIVAHE